MSQLDQPENQVSESRRRFLASGALAGVALASGNALGQRHAASGEVHADDSDKLRLTLAGYDYDRVKGLIDGSVQIENCMVDFEVGRIGELNAHVFSGPKTREASEVGLLPFVLAFANDGFRDYTLLPIFPLRTFRHKSIFIRNDRGIEKPEDLPEGKSRPPATLPHR